MELQTDCILWTGALTDKGYARAYLLDPDGKHRSSRGHRVAWAEAKGPIPEGMQVLHHCDVRHCVNVEHLYLGRDRENMRDRSERGPHHRKTHCNRGHELTMENTYTYSRSGRSFRICKICRRASDTRRRKVIDRMNP